MPYAGGRVVLYGLSELATVPYDTRSVAVHVVVVSFLSLQTYSGRQLALNQSQPSENKADSWLNLL